jgi:hypothetical protein
MMMLNNTNWRNVWLIHDTRVTALPELTADGSETIASAANAYAHHIVPTPSVTLTANQALKRAYQGAVAGWTITSETFGGPAAARAAIRG